LDNSLTIVIAEYASLFPATFADKLSDNQNTLWLFLARFDNSKHSNNSFTQYLNQLIIGTASVADN